MTPITQDAVLIERARAFAERWHMYEEHRELASALADRLEALSQAVNAPQGEAVAWRYRSAPHRPWFFTRFRETAEAEIADGSEVQPLFASPALAEPEGWRGIESAPTDGRNVLVFCPRASDHGYNRIRLTWRKDGKWQGANNTSWPPTHWMPLPASPTVEER